MKFMYCNFLENHSMARKNHKGVTHVGETSSVAESNVSCVKTYLVNDGEGLVFAEENEAVKGVAFDFIGSVKEHEEHTDENPLIAVATSKFKVYKDIPAHIKYILVKDGVIVALLSGYISVAGPDGSMIPLSRNCDALCDDNGVVFTADEIYAMNGLEDKDSGIKYSDYVVNDCVIKLTVAKDGRYLKSIKYDKSAFSVMNKEIFEKGKAKKEAEAKAREERRKQKEAENAKYMAERSIREKQMEEARKAEKESKTTRKPKAINEEEEWGAADGAKAFLDFVANAKNRSK